MLHWNRWAMISATRFGKTYKVIGKNLSVILGYFGLRWDKNFKFRLLVFNIFESIMKMTNVLEQVTFSSPSA